MQGSLHLGLILYLLGLIFMVFMGICKQFHPYDSCISFQNMQTYWSKIIFYQNQIADIFFSLSYYCICDISTIYFSIQIPYAQHYKLRFFTLMINLQCTNAVYNQERLILQTIYVLNKEMWAKNSQFIIKSSFKSRAGYNGA